VSLQECCRSAVIDRRNAAARRPYLKGSPPGPSGLARTPGLTNIEAVKTSRSLPILAIALALSLSATVQAEENWQTDLKKAQEQAKADKKLLLVDFTGSDWCGWCIRLNKEVFSKPEFKEYANKNLVLLEIDFPRAKAQTESIKHQNQELASQYQIQGFPTIIVLNSQGRKVGELGYMQGGPSAFIAELEKLPKG
jgi:thioredoxin-related protein